MHAVRKGIRRELGVAQVQKLALTLERLRPLLKTLERERLIDLRDRALLLVGFASGCRRSELVALNVSDLHEQAEGLRIRIRRSKTDQEGRGRTVGVPRGESELTCPVMAMTRWVVAANIGRGAVFRSINRHDKLLSRRLTAQSVALVVKRRALCAGLDPNQFSAHSLRSGLVTTAALAGKSESSIMKQTGHRSSRIVRRYIQESRLFEENAAVGIGL